VTSRFIDENGMSWIDRIEWAIENASRGSLRLPWAREPVQLGDIESKIAVLDDIRTNVKSNSDLDPDKLVSDLFLQLDLDEIHSSDDPLDRKMTWRQVREWISPGFIIGGHGHTHSILSFLAPARLDWELDTSLRMIRERAGWTARHFSYPEGLAHCYSPEVIAGLRRRGIVCSPTAIDGVNPPAADPYHLRRVMVS
jgi:hypothetical protein